MTSPDLKRKKLTTLLMWCVVDEQIVLSSARRQSKTNGSLYLRFALHVRMKFVGTQRLATKPKTSNGELINRRTGFPSCE
jgi:hypothetical protein